MSNGNEDDPLAGILGEELGEWDKMFDSLHETAEAEAAENAVLKTDPPTPVVKIDAAAIDGAALDGATVDPPTPVAGDALDFALSESTREYSGAVPEPLPPSPFEDDGGFTLGPPGAVPSGIADEGEAELSFGGVPEALGTLLGSEGHDDLDLEIEQSQESSSTPKIVDVALADVLGVPEVSAEQELARISHSANAFFDDGPSDTPAFALDEDFYEGIEVGSNAIPTPIPEDEPIDSMAYHLTGTAPEASSSIGADGATPAGGVVIPDAAKRPDAVPEALAAAESDGVPQSIGEQGHGALRTGAVRAESEDSLELASEVDGALESIRSGPSTPPPEGVALEPTATIESEDEASPRIDGVVDAAFDDAVAMSTGTLHTGPQLLEADVEPDLPKSTFAAALPELDLARIHVVERVEPDVSNRTEEVARLLVLYERELSILDEPGATIRMRIESGRLAESLGDLDRARRHLDEALKLDPRLVPANRALRRIERRLGNWDQVLSQLDNEIQKAGAMEARALSAYRADLLMAVGEPDLARVAVGALLDSAPSDTRALLANLELAFVDGREEEVRGTLAALADTLSGPRLRSVIYEIGGMIAARDGDAETAAGNYAQADQAHPNLGAQLAQSTLSANGEQGKGLAQLVGRVSENNSDLGAAFAWLAAEAETGAGNTDAVVRGISEAGEALAAHPLLVNCRLRVANDAQVLTESWQQLASGMSGAAEKSWALHQAMQCANQAEAPEALALAEAALAVNPKSAYAQLWVQRLGAAPDAAIPPADAPQTVPAAFRQARLLQGAQDYPGASAVVASLVTTKLAETPSLRPYGLELAHASGDLAAQSRGYSDMARDAGSETLSRHAGRSAARALSRIARQADAGTDAGLLVQAAEAWRDQADLEPGIAAETALLLATASSDETAIAECTAVAIDQAQSERRSQLAVDDACRALGREPNESAEALAALLQEYPTMRASELFWSVALSTSRVGEASDALEARVNQDSLPAGNRPAGDRKATDHASRIDRNRFRSAYARVQNDLNLDVAVESLSALVASRPTFGAANTLLATALGHGGQGSSTVFGEPSASAGEPSASAGEPSASAGEPSASQRAQSPTLPNDSISAAIRQIEAVARTGAVGEAADRGANLRAQYPDDALVRHTFERFAWLACASADLAEPVLARLRLAEERGDSEAKAEACEELARIDLELRGDRDSARMFWESASNAAPTRADLQRILEGEYRGSEAHLAQRRVMLGRVIACLSVGEERSAYLLARARLSQAMGRDADAVRSDYESALEDDALCREALFYLESEASQAGPTEELANLEASVSQYFSDDPRARGAFLVRSGETWRSLGQRDQCLARLKAALQVVPGFAPALSAWRDLALDHELWEELSEACLLEAISVDSDAARASLFLLAGVTLMDKVSNAEGAISALRKVLVVSPLDREAFVRLRQLYLAKEAHEDLAQLFSMRLAATPASEQERCELHLSLARVLRSSLDNDAEALVHYRALLALRPNDKEAVTAVSDISWSQAKWADAAEALMVLARIETDTDALVSVFSRLGTIYAEHLPEPRWALKSFHKVVTLEPGNREALSRIAELGAECGEFRLALGACEQLIKQEPPIAQRIDVLIRMASILRTHAEDPKNAERALRHALDLDPSSDAALDALVLYYVEQKDLRSARVHVDRVANAMRKRIRESALDAEAYRVLARAMAAKASAGSAECMPTAQVAASLAIQLGVESAETSALAKQIGAGMGAGLASETFDDLLFPQDASGSARTLFALLGGRLAKHIGIDIRHHGVGRSDRLRKGIDEAASIILELAAEMGVDDVDIYVSKQKPKLVAVEPTSPFSLLLGADVANAERLAELRFFVGRSLKGASASLSAPLQLGEERFGILLVGLLRLFKPDFAPNAVDADAAAAEQQRLRRLIPSSLLQELQPFALGLATSDFDHRVIWQGMTDACNRAGLLCAGDGSAAISALMRCKGFSDLRKAVQDPEIVSLIRFACSSENGRLWAAMRA